MMAVDVMDSSPPSSSFALWWLMELDDLNEVDDDPNFCMIAILDDADDVFPPSSIPYDPLTIVLNRGAVMASRSRRSGILRATVFIMSILLQYHLINLHNDAREIF